LVVEHRKVQYAAMTMTSGTRLGPYEIRTARVVPGPGELYDARDHDQQRDVALRVLRVDFAAAPDRLTRFEQESQAAAQVVHPNILTVHDIGTDAEVAYIVSEPMDGQTLHKLLEAGPLPAATVARYAAALANGLAAAHMKGIVHRDLTPANILVAADGDARIIGLGLASATQKESALAGGALLGTLSYMSPEQLQGAAVDGRSDMFTFGAIVYEMMTGTRAFSGGALDTMSAVMESQTLPPFDPEHPAALTGIVGRCLKNDPEARVSADEVVQVLRDMDSQHSPADPVAEPVVPVAGRRFGRAAATLVVVGITAVVGLRVFGGGRNSGGTIADHAGVNDTTSSDAVTRHTIGSRTAAGGLRAGRRRVADGRHVGVGSATRVVRSHGHRARHRRKSRRLQGRQLVAGRGPNRGQRTCRERRGSRHLGV